MDEMNERVKNLSVSEIELDKLAESCINLVKEVREHYSVLGELKSKICSFKAKLEYTKAKQALTIRANFTENNVKFTEAMVTSSVEINEEVVKWNEKLHDCEYLLALVSANIAVLEFKQNQLNNLVKLNIN